MLWPVVANHVTKRNGGSGNENAQLLFGSSRNALLPNNGCVGSETEVKTTCLCRGFGSVYNPNLRRWVCIILVWRFLLSLIYSISETVSNNRLEIYIQSWPRSVENTNAWQFKYVLIEIILRLSPWWLASALFKNYFAENFCHKSHQSLCKSSVRKLEDDRNTDSIHVILSIQTP